MQGTKALGEAERSNLVLHSGELLRELLAMRACTEMAADHESLGTEVR